MMEHSHRRPSLVRAPHSSPTTGSRDYECPSNVWRAPSPHPGPRRAEPVSKRSSSIYSHATDWGFMGDWQSEAPPLPVLHQGVLKSTRFSASSPSLLEPPGISPLTPELVNTLPPMLEPRTYQPLLPSPSPSLRPILSHDESNTTTVSNFSFRREDDPLWNNSAGDRYSLAPSPPPISPASDRGNSELHVQSLLFRHQSWHKRSQSADSPLVARLTRPFGPPPGDRVVGAHMRKDSIAHALSHIRLGSDISRIDNVSLARSNDEKAPGTPPDESISSNCQDRLASAQISDYEEDWNDGSRVTDDALDIKYVPRPLFWAQRSKELYPNRFVYAQQKEAGEQPLRIPRSDGRRKRVSFSAAPLKLLLSRQKDHRSVDRSTWEQDSPISASLKKSLFIRQRTRGQLTQLELETLTSTIGGKSISALMQQAPLQLQCPTASHREASGRSRLPKTRVHAFTSIPYGCKSPRNASAAQRVTDRRPEFDGHSREPGSFHALKMPFHRTNPSAASGTGSVTEHDTASSGRLTKAQFAAAFSHGHERRSIFDKATEAMRDRDRNKWRKDLKSKIKIVGQVDPSDVHNSPPTAGKTSIGRNWI